MAVLGQYLARDGSEISIDPYNAPVIMIFVGGFNKTTLLENGLFFEMV